MFAVRSAGWFKVNRPNLSENWLDDWGREVRSTDRYRHFTRADPELAMIDMKRQHQRVKDERLPGETLHDALCRVAGLVDNGRNYSADNPRSDRR